MNIFKYLEFCIVYFVFCMVVYAMLALQIT